MGYPFKIKTIAASVNIDTLNVWQLPRKKQSNKKIFPKANVKDEIRAYSSLKKILFL